MVEHIKIDVEKKKIKKKRIPIRKKKIFVPPSVQREEIISKRNSVFDIKVEKKSFKRNSINSIVSLRDSRLSPRDPAKDDFYHEFLESKSKERIINL